MKDLKFLKQLTEVYVDETKELMNDIQSETIGGLGNSSWITVKEHFTKLGFDISDINGMDEIHLRNIVTSIVAGSYMLGLLETDKKTMEWREKMQKKLKLVK
jgi:hypothetical protein